MKEKAKHYQKLDFSRLDVRVRCVLRKLGVDTVGKLLALTEQDVSAIKNCGDKTTAKIITLQKEYRIPRAIVKQREMTVEGAIESSRSYIYRLITVAIAANGLIESAKGSDRYHFRVSKQRFNTLKGALEALRARQQ